MNTQTTQTQEEKFVALCESVTSVLRESSLTRAEGTLICLTVAAMLSAPDGFEGNEDMPDEFKAMVPIFAFGGMRPTHFTLKAMATAVRSILMLKDMKDNAENN